MRKIIIIASFFILTQLNNNCSAQSVGINTPFPDASTVLDIRRHAKGILVPCTSATSRLAIANPSKRNPIDPSNNYVFEYNDVLYSYIGPASGEFFNPSHVRLKKDIIPLGNIPDRVMALSPKKISLYN